MAQPKTLSDFIALLTAVKEQYGDIDVKYSTSGDVEATDEHYEFDDVVMIQNQVKSLVFDDKYYNKNDSYLLFM